MTRLLAALTVLIASAAMADTITMKNAVRLGADAQSVTLADVAVLDGPLVETLGAIVIRPMPDEAVEIDVRDLRRVLDTHGVHWLHRNSS